MVWIWVGEKGLGFKVINQIRRIFFSVLIIIDMYKVVLWVLALITISLAACPANYNINNLVADSVSFNLNPNSPSSSQTFIYNFNQNFNNSPALALALHDFSINNLAANKFAVYPSTVSNSQITFQFDYSSPVWSRVKVNFWATTHNQIQLGYFKVDNIQTIGSCNCALAYANINAPFAKSDNPVIRVFINGFDVSSNVLQISVSPTNLQATKLTVRITVGAKTGLRSIWLSWLAFSPSTASFGSYGGQVSQSKYSGSVSSDISNSLYQSPYVLYGLNLITLSNNQPLTFSASIDSDFILTIAASSTVDDFSLVYITVGILPSKVCANCAKGLVANGNNCVSSCPVGSYSFNYKDGGVGCRTCSTKLGLILSGGKCVQGSVSYTSTTTSTIITAPSNTIAQPPSNSNSASSSTSTSSASSSTLSSDQIKNILVPSTPTPAPLPSSKPQTATITTIFAPTLPVCPANAFFNGNECVCDVGYVFQNGKCQVPNIPTTVPVIIAYPGQKPCNTTSSTASSTASTSSGSTSSSTGTTSSSTGSTSTGSDSSSTGSSSTGSTSSSTGSGSTNSGSAGSGSTGSGSSGAATSTTNQTSSSQGSSSCGPNSYNNGLGICVCNQGSYFSNGACVFGTQCPANSKKQENQQCVCNPGFTNYSNTCSKCPPGALWSSKANKCIYICGQNSAFSESAGVCVCNPGFGIFGGFCQACPNNYFISNGYCVTCPVNSAFNPATKNCDCLSGFFTNQWGICARKCGTNEVYDSATQKCSCLQGLGRVNGACQICPSGSTPSDDGSSCSSCKANQVLVNGECICKQGFAYNEANVCVICSSLPNGFIQNGFCAVCPGNLIYNGQSCTCPAGKQIQGSLCISQCQDDQLLDDKGNCYTCGSNQVISNGACVCSAGYSRNSCGVCSLSCGAGQFVFQGACAVCPLNTIFNSAINGCSCPQGFYMDTYGVCQKLQIKPITCASGLYFDQNNGCVACSSSCATCKSATQCITCASTGFTPNAQGVCAPRCGDGLIVGNEQCDTGASSSEGCVRCQIQRGFICSGQPSICKSTAPPTPTPPIVPPIVPPVVISGAALVQNGKTNINSNNVFITLKTGTTFTFSNPTEMQGFLQATFPSGPKPTVYCSQRNSPNLDLFDCLLIYPSGVPNKKFVVNFAYNYQGKSGSASINVDPLAANKAIRK